jgi:outer membrane lipoprotein SlyB
MKKLLSSLTILSIFMPSVVLSSGPRRMGVGPAPLKDKAPKCLVEEKWKPCKITIDETGVIGPEGHITNVVQWTTDEKAFNMGGALGGAVAGGVAGTGIGLGSCVIFGPLCIITAPAIMSGGVTGGATVGGKAQGKFFTIVGDDSQGTRLIQEFYYSSGKQVKKTTRTLLLTTKLAEGELRNEI